MKSTIEMVREFHDAFRVANRDLPYITDPATNTLRLKLLDEELGELREALEKADPVAVLDALTDLQYVLDGAYLQLGFAGLKDAAFAEVHRSNMSKLGGDGKPIRREDGKIIKGPAYEPPNLTQFL